MRNLKCLKREAFNQLVDHDDTSPDALILASVHSTDMQKLRGLVHPRTVWLAEDASSDKQAQAKQWLPHDEGQT